VGAGEEAGAGAGTTLKIVLVSDDAPEAANEDGLNGEATEASLCLCEADVGAEVGPKSRLECLVGVEAGSPSPSSPLKASDPSPPRAKLGLRRVMAPTPPLPRLAALRSAWPPNESEQGPETLGEGGGIGVEAPLPNPSSPLVASGPESSQTMLGLRGLAARAGLLP